MVEVEPAFETEAFFETIYVLARDGKLGANASLTPPDRGLARWTPSWGDVPRQAPVLVQKAFAAIAAPVGRLLGYRDRYPEYSPS
jgi:hypothetical protein